ncbi:NAD-dependent epimerase/dehydratase family protein [Shewanella mangrovisoli]|uniref:NAD-dependent epimerase/dehydratase family protein n=1 Tax=Shewanella mangrovisoli TaxID=2864211 RepID=A0ABV4VFY3_9GAMM
MNIVITGSNGFIGRKLLEKLKIFDFNIKLVDRLTHVSDFKSIFDSCDFCFHLAGEVRPTATRDEFYNSNVILTQNIINSIDLNLGKTKILFASTIHAGKPKNDYGYSKLEAENIISLYNKKYNLTDLIFRLPHLFGTGAKPEHNSVFATWIYNVVNGKSLNVYDGNVQMTYIQVDELIEVFIRQLFCEYRVNLPESYFIQLGDLKEMILSLHNGASPKNKLEYYVLEMLNDASRK